MCSSDLRLRAIAMTTQQRARSMPDVPTFIESGLAGYEVNGWYGLFTTANTPTAIVEKLNVTLRQILTDTDTRAQFARNGLEPSPLSTAEFSKLLKSEIVKWAKVIKAAGIQPE